MKLQTEAIMMIAEGIIGGSEKELHHNLALEHLSGLDRSFNVNRPPETYFRLVLEKKKMGCWGKANSFLKRYTGQEASPARELAWVRSLDTLSVALRRIIGGSSNRRQQKEQTTSRYPQASKGDNRFGKKPSSSFFKANRTSSDRKAILEEFQFGRLEKRSNIANEIKELAGLAFRTMLNEQEKRNTLYEVKLIRYCLAQSANPVSLSRFGRETEGIHCLGQKKREHLAYIIAGSVNYRMESHLPGEVAFILGPIINHGHYHSASMADRHYQPDKYACDGVIKTMLLAAMDLPVKTMIYGPVLDAQGSMCATYSWVEFGFNPFTVYEDMGTLLFYLFLSHTNWTGTMDLSAGPVTPCPLSSTTTVSGFRGLRWVSEVTMAPWVRETPGISERSTSDELDFMQVSLQDLTRPLDELIGFEMPQGFQYNELLNIVATTVLDCNHATLNLSNRFAITRGPVSLEKRRRWFLSESIIALTRLRILGPFSFHKDVVELIGSKKPQGSQYNELLNIFAKPTYPPIMQDEMNSSHWTTWPGPTDDPVIILRKATDNVSSLLTHAGCRGCRFFLTCVALQERIRLFPAPWKTACSRWTNLTSSADGPPIFSQTTDNMFSFPTEDSSTGIDGVHPDRPFTLDEFTKFCGWSTDSFTKPPITCSAFPPKIAQPVLVCTLNYHDKVHHRITYDIWGEFSILTQMLELIGSKKPSGSRSNELLNILANLRDGKQRKSLLIKYTTSQLDLSKNNRVDGISHDSPWFGSGRSLCVGDDLDILVCQLEKDCTGSPGRVCQRRPRSNDELGASTKRALLGGSSIRVRTLGENGLLHQEIQQGIDSALIDLVPCIGSRDDALEPSTSPSALSLRRDFALSTGAGRRRRRARGIRGLTTRRRKSLGLGLGDGEFIANELPFTASDDLTCGNSRFSCENDCLYRELDCRYV
ncbi:hypothetical protein C8J56DRAFT_879769 [Mycena floridula]|nr:hypothetical protein C8J56DRAFT_879769 [Mycena floridula]